MAYGGGPSSICEEAVLLDRIESIEMFDMVPPGGSGTCRTVGVSFLDPGARQDAFGTV
jgi:hypothetical protein